MILKLIKDRKQVYLQIQKGKKPIPETCITWLRENEFLSKVEVLQEDKSIRVVGDTKIKQFLELIKTLPSRHFEYSEKNPTTLSIIHPTIAKAIINSDINPDNFESITEAIFSDHVLEQDTQLKNLEFANSAQKQAQTILDKISELCNNNDFWRQNTSGIALFKNRNTAPKSIVKMRQIIQSNHPSTSKLQEIINIATVANRVSPSSFKFKKRYDDTQEFYNVIASLKPLNGISNLVDYEQNIQNLEGLDTKLKLSFY